MEFHSAKEKKLAAAAGTGSPLSTSALLFDLKSNTKALLVALIFVGAFLMVTQGLYWSRGYNARNAALELDHQQLLLGTATTTHSRRFSTAEKESQAKEEQQAPLEEPGRGIHSAVRHLQPLGLAAYTFVLTGGYRTQPSSFAVVGLASKPLHVFGKPRFACEWIPAAAPGAASTVFVATPRVLLPDWGYGRVYTVVVVHCYFNQPVGADATGGKLLLYASTGERGAKPEKITAFSEAPGEFNASAFQPPFRYDYLYCGSSTYGDLEPQRMREWIAYHAMLFGPRSHFVLHDVGGLRSPEMKKVLAPWVKAGRVTVQDFSEQARYDGYYYNQFLLVNDCLFRYKHMANWTFFFDVDEYVHIPKPGTLDSVLDELGQNYSQIMFEQNLMGHNVCVEDDGRSREDRSSQWGFEKLVFKDVKKAVRLDRKYVLKAALADSAGVHLSEHIKGKSLYSKGKIVYYHYHNTLTEHGDNCKEFHKIPNDTATTARVWSHKIPYVYDDSMSSLAAAAKRYEHEQIGDLVTTTRAVNRSSRS